MYSEIALISPIPYVPQTIGVLLGRLFSIGPLGLLYFARLGNLIGGILLIAFALSMVDFSPRLKLAMFIMAGVPMTLFLISSVSSNGTTNALALCLVAAGASLRERFDRRRFTVFLGFSAAMSIAKSAYFILPLALLPTLWASTKSSKIRWRRVGLLTACSVLPMLAWTLLVRHLYRGTLLPGTNPTEAAKLALRQPLTTLHIYYESIRTYYTFYKETFIGRVGWHDTSIPYRVVKHYFHALYLVAFIAPLQTKASAERASPPLHRLWIFSVALANAFLVYTIIFFIFRPVGATQVEGVQGRHMMPIFPLLFLAAWPVVRLKPRYWKMWRGVLIGGWAISTAIVLYCTATRYWGA